MGNEWWLWMPNETTALNAIMQMWLRTSNGKWTMALNAKLKTWLWTPNGKWTMALNTKLKARLWTPKWKRGSEHQMGNEQWLWTPNGKWTMALNAKTKEQWWLWTPKPRRHGGSKRQAENAKMWWRGEICPSVTCRHNSPNTGRV